MYPGLKAENNGSYAGNCSAQYIKSLFFEAVSNRNAASDNSMAPMVDNMDFTATYF